MKPWQLMMRGIKAALVVCVLGAQALPAAEAPSDKLVTLAIPAQPISEALTAFAQQAGVQILYYSALVDGMIAPELVGTFTREAALTKLLANTPLQYQFVNDRMVAIRSKDSSPEQLSHASPVDQLRMAMRGDATEGSTASTIEKSKTVEESEVVVTGSHIRTKPGEGSAGSRVIEITAEEIERSGHARLEDFFESLPQNFSGSASEDNTTIQNSFNNNRGTTIDLRGLGGGTTLILVNGHRQPAGDFRGSFVDISSIPTSAIERIEVLTDGASAVYGSDAIGGVVNFILKKDYDGAESGLRYGTLDGNADEIQFSQLFGKSWSTGHGLIGYQYYERDPLQYEDVPYLAVARDMRSFGGSDFRTTYFSNPGVILCPAGQPNCPSGRPGYAIPTGQDGTALSASDLIPLNGVLPVGYPLNYTNDRWHSAQEKLHTVFLTASQHINEQLELFAEGRYAQRDMKVLANGTIRTVSVPSTNYYYVNPFGTTAPVSVAYNFYDDLGPYTQLGDIDTHSERLGLTAQFNTWRVTLSGSYGGEKNQWLALNALDLTALSTALAGTTVDTALNVFGDGSHSNPAVLNSIRTSNIINATSTIRGGELVADGPLFQLFSNDVRLATGLDYRSESLDVFQRTSSIISIAENRSVGAAFAELAVPLVQRDNARAGVQQLELSLAGRYEDYSDFGKTLNPKIGIRWQPINSLQLRGTWGSSFRAPKLADTADALFTASIRQQNSIINGTTYSILLVQGRNPDLHEEIADIWTAGFDFSPEAIEGLEIAMTYFDIDYTDKIARPALLTAISNADAYVNTGLLVRNPSRDVVDALCNDPLFTAGNCSRIDYLFTSMQRNLSKVRVSGIDLDINYPVKTSYGTFSFGLNGAYLSRYDQLLVSGTPALDVLDTVGNPLELRLRGKLSWMFKNWGTHVFINHTGSYKNPGGSPAQIDSLATVDLNLNYRLTSSNAWLDNSRFSLSVVNLFDEPPPFMNVDVGYDTANGDLAGRKMSLQFTKEWGGR